MGNDSGPPEAHDDKLVNSALSLLVSNGLSAVLGVVFWVVTAHLFSPVNVGYGVAEIAAMSLIASVAQFSPSVIFQRFLFASGTRAGAVLRVGYAAVSVIAVLVGVGFLSFTGHHAYLEQGTWPRIIFLASIVVWVIFSIEDSALVGLRKAVWVPVENTAFSAGKILMLPIFAILTPAAGVFYSWIVPVVGCIIPVNYYLFRRLIPRHVARSQGRSVLPSRKVIGSILFGEYLGGLAFIAMTTLPALFIMGRLGAVQAAYFQTPWLAGISFDYSLWSIAVALISESSARPSSADSAVRKAVRLSLALMIPGVIVLTVGAPYFLDLLGGSYAQHGTQLLRSLALATPFMGVNILYITFARMARRVRRVVALQLTLSTVVLVLTVVLIGPMGITGTGVAFLAGQALMAMVVLPSVVMQYRRERMAPGFAPERSVAAYVDPRMNTSVEGPMISPDTTRRMSEFPFDGWWHRPGGETRDDVGAGTRRVRSRMRRFRRNSDDSSSGDLDGSFPAPE